MGEFVKIQVYVFTLCLASRAHRRTLEVGGLCEDLRLEGRHWAKQSSRSILGLDN